MDVHAQRIFRRWTSARPTPIELRVIKPNATPLENTSNRSSAWKSVEALSSAPPAPEVIDQQLGDIARLELELSRIVSQDLDKWRFGGLQAELQQLERSANDMSTREQSRRLLNRTAEFVDLQRRHEALVAGQLAPVSGATTRSDERLTPYPTNGSADDSPVSCRRDAV